MTSLQTKFRTDYKLCFLLPSVLVLVNERLLALGKTLKKDDISIPQHLLEKLTGTYQEKDYIIIDHRTLKKMLKFTWYKDIDLNTRRGFFAKTPYSKTIFDAIATSTDINVDFAFIPTKNNTTTKKTANSIYSRYPASMATITSHISVFCIPGDSIFNDEMLDKNALVISKNLNKLNEILSEHLIAFDAVYSDYHLNKNKKEKITEEAGKPRSSVDAILANIQFSGTMKKEKEFEEELDF